MSKAWLTRVSSTVLVAIVLLLGFSTALAVQGPQLDWFTVDGGGGVSTGTGGYLLAGTTGQPDAGLLTGGAYALTGGFWAGGAHTVDFKIYLPLVVRALTG